MREKRGVSGIVGEKEARDSLVKRKRRKNKKMRGKSITMKEFFFEHFRRNTLHFFKQTHLQRRYLEKSTKKSKGIGVETRNTMKQEGVEKIEKIEKKTKKKEAMSMRT